MKSERPLTTLRWRLGCGLLAASSLLVACEDEPQVGNSNAALVRAASCNDVREHVVDVTTENILRSYYYYYPVRGGPPLSGAPEDGGAPPASPSAGGGDAPTDYTKTNVQEEGVDENDLIKTDGSFIYTARGEELVIMKSWPAPETAIVARLALGAGISADSLFLNGDRAIVFSSVYGQSSDKVSENFYGLRVSVIDVSNRSAPRVIATRDLETMLTSARMIGDKVYVVGSGAVRLPDSVWSQFSDLSSAWEPNLTEEQMLERLEARRPEIRRRVERALADVELGEMVPRTRVNQGAFAPLFGCTDLYLPSTPASLGVLGVFEFDLSETASVDLAATGLLAEGFQVYASSENLYVAQSSRWWWWGFGAQDNDSHLHKFRLGQNGPEYRASGKVDGWILNQFSMSEYQNHLRVATTDNEWIWNEAQSQGEVTGGNHLSVLAERDGALEVVGAVRNLAPGEQIYSARMMGPKGYLVTFRQTDPLYTLDLADPANPRVLGELKIPGFSSYMHPLGPDHLLTIGLDADEEGRVRGMQLQIFDVSNPAQPTRAHQALISSEPWSSHSEALWDHHAFTFHAERGILAFPAVIYGADQSEFTGILVYRVSATEGFSAVGRVSHGDLASDSLCREIYQSSECPPDVRPSWWISMRRSVFIEDALYSLSNVGLKVSPLLMPEQTLATVQF